MRRREVITLLGGAAAAWPVAARAQSGYDRSGTQAFFEALRTFGFSAGDNLVADIRWVDEDVRGPSVLAGELVQSKVDVLVAEGTEATLQAAVAAGRDIPTVMVALNNDPIARGYIKAWRSREVTLPAYSSASRNWRRNRSSCWRRLSPIAPASRRYTRPVRLSNSLPPTGQHSCSLKTRRTISRRLSHHRG